MKIVGGSTTKYFTTKIKRYEANGLKIHIGQGLPKLTPVEIVGYEVCEAGSPLALDNG